MKRSKHIALDMMRKASPPPVVLRPVAVAIAALALSACSSQEDVVVVGSVDECTSKTTLSRADCDAAYKKAQSEAALTGPKYARNRNCEAEFGVGQCRQERSGVFMPMMAGFMVGQMMSGSYNPVYRYTNRSSRNYNRIMTADGGVIGTAGRASYRVGSDTLRPKPASTRTVSRGGFGAIASAKSSWGGGRSGGGWGG
jgi:uncharacterized protein YgiB involved in biofilm formation